MLEMTKILAMINLDDYKLPGEVLGDIAKRMVLKRKALGLTQAKLAEKSGVSLASIKRFERLHQISLASLVNIAFTLNCADDFDALFARPTYASIEDVIKDSKKK